MLESDPQRAMPAPILSIPFTFLSIPFTLSVLQSKRSCRTLGA
jgi:hypothetical protein